LRPLVKQWLKKKGLRESSRKRYEQSWNFIFASLPPEPRLADLNVQWWPRFLATRDVTTSTLNRDRAALLAFQSYAKGLALPLPDFTPNRFKEEPVPSEILTNEQIIEVRKQCRPDRWPFFWTLLETGARQGQVLNLRRKDVSVDDDTVTFRSAPGNKSKGAERRVPISHSLAVCLDALGTLSGNGKIFPYSRHAVRHWWKSLCKQLEIEDVTPHGLRATFITRGLDSGVSPVDMQKLVGHSSLAMTMRYYRNPEESQTAAARVRSALGFEEEHTTAQQP